MTFGALKTGVRAIINRKDFTDALAGDFVRRAVTEIERICRVGPMEALLEAKAWTGSNNTIAVPSTYLEMIEVFTDAGKLERVDTDTYLSTCETGRPSVFMTVGQSWLIRPYPQPGDTVFVHHYAETIPLLADTDENVWTRSAYNAVLYGAAALAADFFQMEDQYVQRFQGKADQLLENILSQDAREKWSGATSISRPKDAGNY